MMVRLKRWIQQWLEIIPMDPDGDPWKIIMTDGEHTRMSDFHAPAEHRLRGTISAPIVKARPIDLHELPEETEIAYFALEMMDSHRKIALYKRIHRKESP